MQRKASNSCRTAFATALLTAAGVAGLGGCAAAPEIARGPATAGRATVMASERELLSPDGGRRAYRQGMQQIEQLRFDEAIDSFGLALRSLELMRQRQEAQRMIAPGSAGGATGLASDVYDRQHAELLFWLAYAYEKTGRTRSAVRFYSQLAGEHPDQPFAPQAARRAQRLIEQP